MDFHSSSIWDAIVRCLDSYLASPHHLHTTSTSIQPFDPIQHVGSTVQPNQHINSIAQVAARDHFVWFYKQEENQLTAFLGNFHSCPITLWGIQFKCAEAAFQAAKFMPQTTVMAAVPESRWRAPLLGLDGRLSGNWTSAQNAQWRNSNLTFMREIVKAKFNQNPDLKALLLATGNAYLVEHLPRAREGQDPFWSDNFNGKRTKYARSNPNGNAWGSRREQALSKESAIQSIPFTKVIKEMRGSPLPLFSRERLRAIGS